MKNPMFFLIVFACGSLSFGLRSSSKSADSSKSRCTTPTRSSSSRLTAEDLHQQSVHNRVQEKANRPKREMTICSIPLNN
jgi:hypothetical protein